MDAIINLKYVLNAVVFSVLGLLLLSLSIWVFDRLTPGDLWKDIVEEHNVALGVVLAAKILAVGLIIASAIHG